MPDQLIRQFLSEPDFVATCGTTTDFLVAESNHRIANHLGMLAALMQLQASDLERRNQALTAAEAAARLREVSARIDAVARLHRLLSQAPGGAAPELGGYLCEVALAVLNSVSLPGAAPRFSAEIRGKAASCGDALAIGVIVGELVTNSLKYAHPTGVRGALHLRCDLGADGALAVEVRDDGVGLPEGFDPRRDGGLGLRLVRSLADQLGATIDFEQSGLGLSVRVSIRPNVACSRAPA